MPVQERPPENEPNSPRPKWETEIREIFDASERDPSLTDKARGKVTHARYKTRPELEQRVQSTRSRMSTGALMLIVLTLAVSGFALRHVSLLLGQLLAFAALIAFVVLLYQAFIGNRNKSPESPFPTSKGPEGSNPTIEAWKNRIRRDDEESI